MNTKKLKIILASTPIGYIGSGRGGGVELTLISLLKGLVGLGHEVTLVAPEGSFLPDDFQEVQIHHIQGEDQPK